LGTIRIMYLNVENATTLVKIVKDRQKVIVCSVIHHYTGFYLIVIVYAQMDFMKIPILNSAFLAIKIVKLVQEELLMIVRVVKLPIIELYRILNATV
jgi:hypothetical protein